MGFEAEQKQKQQAESEVDLDKKRSNAERERSLMKSQAARMTDLEKKKNGSSHVCLDEQIWAESVFEKLCLGLVIQRAWYGQFDENEDYPSLSAVCYSVATPLQVCVNQSKLILNQGLSKVSETSISLNLPSNYTL